MSPGKPKKPREPQHAARSAQWAIIGLGIYLVVLFLSGVILLQLVIRNQQNFLPDYLTLVGRTITDPPRDYFFFLEFLTDPETGDLDEEQIAYYSELLPWENVADSLRAASGEKLVQSAHLLTPAGEIILNDEGEVPGPLERSRFVQREGDWIAQAAEGDVYIPPQQPITGKRLAFLPVRIKAEDGSAGKVVGVLRMETVNPRFGDLARLRNRMIVGFILSGAVLGFLYFVTVRLVRRVIEAEQAASQADRLRAMGTMTAGIAHEIRNPLGIVTLQIEEMRALLDSVEDEKLRATFEAITADLQEEARRLKNLTEQFVKFSGGGEAEHIEPVEIDTVEQISRLVKIWEKGLSPEKRRVSLHLPEGAEEQARCRATFTHDGLRQVLLNLLRNADEAIGERKGEIRIDVRRRQDEVEISVADNGPGIDPATQRQLFDPFFTTKSSGTGLGLSLSRSLAQSAGGDLTVASTAGKGARFVLTLPCAVK